MLTVFLLLILKIPAKKNIIVNLYPICLRIFKIKSIFLTIVSLVINENDIK